MWGAVGEISRGFHRRKSLPVHRPCYVPSMGGADIFFCVGIEKLGGSFHKSQLNWSRVLIHFKRFRKKLMHRHLSSFNRSDPSERRTSPFLFVVIEISWLIPLSFFCNWRWDIWIWFICMASTFRSTDPLSSTDNSSSSSLLPQVLST